MGEIEIRSRAGLAFQVVVKRLGLLGGKDAILRPPVAVVVWKSSW